MLGRYVKVAIAQSADEIAHPSEATEID
jgi:hypothetical protein